MNMFDSYPSDIDWFCFINGCPIHIASNGGPLPHGLYTPTTLTEAFNAVQASESSFDWDINREFIRSQIEAYGYTREFDIHNRETLLLPKFINRDKYDDMTIEQIAYSWSFIEMAKKGFFSFDRVNENLYRLVAYPTKYAHSFIDSTTKEFIIPPFPQSYCHACSIIKGYFETETKILSTTRHLFTDKPITFGLNTDIDLIDLINSIIAPE